MQKLVRAPGNKAQAICTSVFGFIYTHTVLFSLHICIIGIFLKHIHQVFYPPEKNYSPKGSRAIISGPPRAEAFIIAFIYEGLHTRKSGRGALVSHFFLTPLLLPFPLVKTDLTNGTGVGWLIGSHGSLGWIPILFRWFSCVLETLTVGEKRPGSTCRLQRKKSLHTASERSSQIYKDSKRIGSTFTKDWIQFTKDQLGRGICDDSSTAVHINR